MQNKISKIWGVGLIVVILASLLISVIPVSAGTLTLSKETDYPSTTDNIFITAATLGMAVSTDGNTVYAVTNAAIYKSTNAGATFSSITLPTGLAAPARIAVAPDDANVVVVTGDTFEAYVSTNAGSTFSSLMDATNNITNGLSRLLTINDLTISPLDGSTRYIAISGTDSSTNGGCLFYFNLGSAAPTWKNAIVGGSSQFTTGPTSGNVSTVLAAAFSPNFPSDQILVVVTANVSGGIGDTLSYRVASFNQKKWDADVFASYPVVLDTTTVGGLASLAADIALDPVYLGGDDTTRIGFVGFAGTDGGTQTGGIFRFKDVTKKELTSSASAVNSIDWNGTNLVAGAYDSNNVYRSDDALATSPTVSSARSNKRIGITGATDQVMVKWAGTSVYGIKQGNGAAFSKSVDNGRTWNDQALMLTTTPNYSDFDVANDGSAKYLLTNDATYVSLFRKATAWQRVFMTTSAAANAIIRLSPDNGNVVYIAFPTVTTMFYSTSGGLENWTQRTSRYNIGDLAVQSIDVAYISKDAGTTVSKSTNGGFTWGTEKESTVSGGNIATITVIASDQIVVGSTTGYVAYSTDGNASWTKISTALNVAGNTQVTADNLAANGYIYACTSGNTTRVERWQIGQSGTTWKNMSAPVSTGYSYTGIALYGGVLYAIGYNGASSELNRDIDPTNSVPAATQWSTVAATGSTFSRTPSSIEMSSTVGVSNKLWIINDTTADEIFSFTDTLIPSLVIAQVTPADKFINPINPVNGNSQDIVFSWTAPTTGSLAYEVRIYAADQTTTIITGTKAAIETATPSTLIGPNQSSTGTNQMSFSPGTVYYWAVRVSSPVYSAFSAKRSFTIQALEAPVPAILAPANGANIEALNPSFSWGPISGTTSYTFQLGLAPDFGVPLVNVTTPAAGIRPTVKLEAGMVYFWRVRAQAPVQGDWSATANFMVVAPVETAPPVVITQLPAPTIVIPPAPAPTTITIPPAPVPPQIAPGYIWAIIIIGAVLVIAVIVLIVRTRRTV